VTRPRARGRDPTGPSHRIASGIGAERSSRHPSAAPTCSNRIELSGFWQRIDGGYLIRDGDATRVTMEHL
jgi:hypothetical protein